MNNEFEERVREMAYMMWESAGRQYGMAMDYWLKAEQEVMRTMTAATQSAMSTAAAATAMATEAATGAAQAAAATTEAAAKPKTRGRTKVAS